MSTTAPPTPRARRAGEITRQVQSASRRLHGLGIVTGAVDAGEGDLEVVNDAIDRGLRAVMAELGSAPRARRVALAGVVVELHDARRAIRALRMAGRGRPLDAIDQSVTRLRNVTSTLGLLDRVCAEAAACCGLARVSLSVVTDGGLSVCRMHEGGETDPGPSRVPGVLATLSLDDAPHERAALQDEHGLVVAAPAPGGDAPPSPMAALFPASHVVVPVPASSSVLGLLHGDHHPTDRPADDLDRDLLAAFARAFGPIYERTALQERLGRQRRALEATLEAESAAAEQLANEGFALPSTSTDETALEAPLHGPPGVNAAVDAILTPREREVLELILSGASNSAIADRLVITTGTVKSHVKRVLRKLGAANRSEAISRYLELGADGARR